MLFVYINREFFQILFKLLSFTLFGRTCLGIHGVPFGQCRILPGPTQINLIKRTKEQNNIDLSRFFVCKKLP
ncbi:hypothetical protein ABEB36_011058 [Hypothenemus hampei]|uniref:Secreted protein n=1 Tax=Hypothenemus hampei TaxID=57062 RepID=A0ABD1EE29_HYPHA